ncbi:winged helix-turn-helix transcriptional regulator [Methanosphaera sp.]
MNNLDKKVVECPVNLAVNLINKKWTIQILRDIFFGKTHFNEFKENKSVSNKVLSECLKEMEENGLIEKITSPEKTNTEYHLTSLGKSMNRVLYELAMFTLNSEISDKYYTEETKNDLRQSFKSTLDIE